MNNNAKRQYDDYDSPWKEVIEQYFQEFVAFFFPLAYNDIDWSKDHKFMDKELRQITRDAKVGRKYVDKLVRVYLKNGERAWAMIHADVQVRSEKEFDERMCIYNCRLYDLYRCHAASFAVIAHSGKWRPGKFERKLWGCKVSFRFPVVNLMNFSKNIKALEKDSNPFAIVIIAHLHTQTTRNDYKRRRLAKIKIIRHLYHKNYSKQDVINLFRFIDWIMRLPEDDEKLFWQELTEIEEEQKMRYVTSVERIGYERGEKIGEKRGEKIGKKRGEKIGEIKILARQVVKKFGFDNKKSFELLQNLGSDDLLEFSDVLFDFDSPDAVYKWVNDRIGRQAEQ